MVERTRTLGFRVAYALGLGTMIAAGIFSLSGAAVDAIGSSAVIAFVIAALVAGVTAASYSEFASIYSENGGGYLFSSRTFENDVLTYAVGVSLFLGYTGTTAFYLATMDEWFQMFLIPEGVPVPHGAVGIVAALLLGALNAQGTEESGSFQVLVTAAKVAVLLVFIAGAVRYAGVGPAATEFATSFQFEPIGIASTAGVAFITFFGFSAIAASAGEIIEPRKTVPRAIAASIVTVTVLYAFVIVALVNTPAARANLLTQGETAMGSIAKVFLGPIGQWLIVAGAIFSMVSASNASILAGSGIGYLMGKQGQAPRRFSRIHPEYGTPFWSVAAVTGTIVAMIALFIAVLGEGSPVPLGLTGLTNFATFNLLAPLSVVNVALIYSRRRYPDVDRPWRVPGAPATPVLGILANVALIGFLAVKGLAISPPTVPEHFVVALPLSGTTVYVGPAAAGVAVGPLVIVGLLAAYLSWGGAPDIDELVTPIAAAATNGAGSEGGSTTEPETTIPDGIEGGDEEFRMLVPIARIHRAKEFARVAERIGTLREGDAHIEFLTVTQVPEQTPTDAVDDVAGDRMERLEAELADLDLGVPYSVHAHVTQDLAFDILHTARESDADRIVMGYPEENTEVAEEVEFNAPCDVLFLNGEGDTGDFSVVTVGAGGGPHHEAMLELAAALAEAGSEAHVVNVRPTGTNGTPEHVEETIDAFASGTDLQVHQVESDDIADALVDLADRNGGTLLIGASRDRLLRRWVFGSTPDRVVELARDRDVPVLVYATSRGFRDRMEELTFPVYRYLRRNV